MKKIRLLLCLVLLFCSAIFSFSRSLYVCLGSFKVKANAENFVRILARYDVTAAIDTADVNGTTMYRVVLAEPFAQQEMLSAAVMRYRKCPLPQSMVFGICG